MQKNEITLAKGEANKGVGLKILTSNMGSLNLIHKKQKPLQIKDLQGLFF